MRILGVTAVAAAMLVASPAFAQSAAEGRATARALGVEGQAALDAKDYKRAEELFRRAEALFNAPTLLLGLARASAGEGKFVEAWEAYNRIILDGLTTTAAFADALENAKKEIGSVEGRRSRVVLNVTGPTTSHVTLDETPVQNDALGVPIFVNPGTHAVKATADGFDPMSQKFEVAEGKTANVSLAMVSNPSAVASPSPSPSPEGGPAPAWNTQKTLALVAGGVGVVGLGVGVAFGIVATSDASTTKTDCQPTTCTPQGHANALSEHSSAATAGDLSTAMFIVGGVGVAAAAVLWFTAPKGEKSPTPATAMTIRGLRFDPVVSAHGTSMMISGSFQ
jgi:hypothetical protein